MPAFLGPDGIGDVSDPGNRQVGRRAGRRLPHRSVDPGRTPFGQSKAVGSGRLGRANDSADVVRIGEMIEDDDQARLVPRRPMISSSVTYANGGAIATTPWCALKGRRSKNAPARNGRVRCAPSPARAKRASARPSCDLGDRNGTQGLAGDQRFFDGVNAVDEVVEIECVRRPRGRSPRRRFAAKTVHVVPSFVSCSSMPHGASASRRRSERAQSFARRACARIAITRSIALRQLSAGGTVNSFRVQRGLQRCGELVVGSMSGSSATSHRLDAENRQPVAQPFEPAR